MCGCLLFSTQYEYIFCSLYAKCRNISHEQYQYSYSIVLYGCTELNYRKCAVVLYRYTHVGIRREVGGRRMKKKINIELTISSR